MKKIFWLLIFILISQNLSIANYNDIYIADIQYDWIKKKAVEKEAIISEVRDIIFEQPVEKIKNLKKDLKGKFKDKDRIEHYLAAAAGRKESGNYNISAFYYKNQKNIYMYAIQDKNDVSKAYYYDALGHLKYVDYIYGEYPEYPYYAIQYKTSGKPISAIYYVSKDNQYLFDPDGTFKGVWYKYNMYDEHSKVILKRSAY
jgi:hypothetical protein